VNREKVVFFTWVTKGISEQQSRILRSFLIRTEAKSPLSHAVELALAEGAVRPRPKYWFGLTVEAGVDIAEMHRFEPIVSRFDCRRQFSRAEPLAKWFPKPGNDYAFVDFRPGG